MPDFGTTFRSAREARNLTLEQVAYQTRISVRFLRAIEEETFHALPGGIFNRGFIRTYADRLGLDPVRMLSEYAVLTEDDSTPELKTVRPISTRPPSDRYVLPVAVGALALVVGLYYAFGEGRTAPAGPEPEPVVTATRAPSIPGGSPADGGTLAVLAPADEAADSADSPAERPDARDADREAATVVEMPDDTEPSSSGEVRPAPTALPEVDADNAPEVADADSVHVQLQVHDATWISVQSDGEQIEVGVTLPAGTSRTFEANQALDLTIGNAAGLTVRINGEEVPSLGNEGQVRRLSITPSNFRRFTGS